MFRFASRIGSASPVVGVEDAGCLAVVGGDAVDGNAVGGDAVGGFTVGGCAVGGCAVDGCAVDGDAVGGFAVDGDAVGGDAVGVAAVGGDAVGVAADDGDAVDGFADVVDGFADEVDDEGGFAVVVGRAVVRVVLAAVVAACGLPLFRIAFKLVVGLAATGPASALPSRAPAGDASPGLEPPSVVLLCLELESLSLSFFRFGFFMFRTTFPVDFTGARFVFIGIVAIPAAIIGDTSAVAAAAVVVVVVVVVPASPSSSVAPVTGVGTAATMTLLVVDGRSQRSLHLHGSLSSTDRPISTESNIIDRPRFVVTTAWSYLTGTFRSLPGKSRKSKRK